MKRSVSIFAILTIMLWLALPAVAFADNCQNMGAAERDRDCSIPEKIIGFFAGLGIMAGIFSKYHNPGAEKKNKNQLNQWGQSAAPKPPPKKEPDDKPWYDPGRYL